MHILKFSCSNELENILPSDQCNLQRNTFNLLCSYFQLLENAIKVEGWLYEQGVSDTTESSGTDQSIELVKTWSMDHVKPKPGRLEAGNRFTVSESGALGISCNESPSLSVMYLDTDKAPIILSNDAIYYSATFVKFRGKEHLAAACCVDGCLHLFDIESKTYMTIFDPKSPKDKRFKYMNICKIDESTIGYGEVYSSLDGSRGVFILKTDTAKEWTVLSTLKLFTPHNIWDMCFKEMVDGTACLLLCIPYGSRIMAVEMEDGKARWEMGKEQMGDTFQPWGICTDQNDRAYVADFGERKIHLLSASDGTVIKRFDVDSYYGFANIFCVRFHDQHLYVEHKIHEGNVQEYAILKFKQFKVM